MSGLLVAALMFGTNWLLIPAGAAAGPGNVATWPAETEIGLLLPPEFGYSEYPYTGVTCTVAPKGDERREQSLELDRPITPTHAGVASITCDEPIFLHAGPSWSILQITGSPLVAVPLFVAMLGGLFFVPRFTLGWARMSNPRWVSRQFDHNRNDGGFL